MDDHGNNTRPFCFRGGNAFGSVEDQLSGGFLSAPFWIGRDPTTSSSIEVAERTTSESATSERQSSTVDQTMIAGEPVWTSRITPSSSSTLPPASTVHGASENTELPDQSTKAKPTTARNVAAIGIGAGLGVFIFIAAIAILAIFMCRRRQKREQPSLPSHIDGGLANVAPPPHYGQEGGPDLFSPIHEHYNPTAESKVEASRAGSAPSELDGTKSVQTNKT